MRIARAFLFASIAVTSSFLWSACVGDDPTTTTSDEAGGPGSLDQTCFGNGTCNSGLSCVSNVCVDLDGGSATADASEDSGDMCDAGALYNSAGYVPCPPPEARCDAIDGSVECCAQSPGSTCPTSSTSCDKNTGALITCVLPTQCNSATALCCVAALDPKSDFVDDTCPRAAEINQATCESSCAANERATCITDADCTRVAGTSCHPYRTTYNGDTSSKPVAFTIGLCVPN